MDGANMYEPPHRLPNHPPLHTQPSMHPYPPYSSASSMSVSSSQDSQLKRDKDSIYG